MHSSRPASEADNKMEKTSLGSKANERRIERLRALRAKFAQQEDLARALHWTAPYLCQLIGPHPTRPISEKTARKIEARLGLASGALDAEPAPRPNGHAFEAASLVAPAMAAVDDELAKHKRKLSRAQYRALVEHVHSRAVGHGGVDAAEVASLVRLVLLFA
jgi:hypothetical protein